MDAVKQEIEKRLLQSVVDFADVKICERNFETNILASGNNYMCTSSRITIKFEKEGKEYEKSFFLKIPYNVPLYKEGVKNNVYVKEIYMYENILRLNKTLLPNDLLHAEFYGTDGKETVILDDLSKCGYRMQDRIKQLDFEHCMVTMKVLAKLHAFSLKVHETQPHLLDPVRKEMVFTTALISSESYRKIFDGRVVKLIRRADPIYAKDHPQVVEFFKDNFLKMAVDNLSADANSLNVLNHGDLWTNNIMFEYDCYGQVTHAKCVDFQGCRWANPATDLIFFTLTSMRFDVFDKYFDLLLQIYANTFNATLGYLKCDHRKLLIQDMRGMFEKKIGYSLMVLLSELPGVVANPKNDFADPYDERFLDEERYVELSRLWVQHFIKNGFFSKYEDLAIAIDAFTREFEPENPLCQRYSLANFAQKSS